VNYRLRGKESDLDEALVRERAAAYGLELSVLRPKKPSLSNLEEQLRDIRYRFFEKVRAKQKASYIAVAHHRDDQAETFLLRLLRGSGLSGLSAMRPKSGHVVRPLIEMTRAEILRYLEERHLAFRTDESNTDTIFLRNRLRHELLPLLEREYQPNIRQTLADTAALLAEDYALFEQVSLLQPKKDGKAMRFSAKSLLSLPEPLLRHQLRLFFRPLFGGKFPPKSVIDEILKLLKSTKNKPQRYTSAGLKIERKGDTVTLLDFTN
jgi:tRNA(Ile)-lysidine synthase